MAVTRRKSGARTITDGNGIVGNLAGVEGPPDTVTVTLSRDMARDLVELLQSIDERQALDAEPDEEIVEYVENLSDPDSRDIGDTVLEFMRATAVGYSLSTVKRIISAAIARTDEPLLYKVADAEEKVASLISALSRGRLGRYRDLTDEYDAGGVDEAFTAGLVDLESDMEDFAPMAGELVAFREFQDACGDAWLFEKSGASWEALLAKSRRPSLMGTTAEPNAAELLFILETCIHQDEEHGEYLFIDTWHELDVASTWLLDDGDFPIKVIVAGEVLDQVPMRATDQDAGCGVIGACARALPEDLEYDGLEAFARWADEVKGQINKLRLKGPADFVL